MNIAIVDDLSREITRITEIINAYIAEKHASIELKSFSGGEEFLENYRPLQYTLVFMDIYMNGMTGVETVRKMRETDHDTLIVFLTTSMEHTFEAFDVHAYQYILKSPDDATLKASVFRVLDEVIAMRSAAEGTFVFSVDGAEQRLPFSKILYAQSSKNYIQIVDDENNLYRTRMTFSEVSGTLGTDSRFLQINRGVIINMDYITDFEKDTCTLKETYGLPINLRDRKKLDQIRKNYVFSKLHSRRNTGGLP